MVKRVRRMDRCSRPASGGGVARVQFPVGAAQTAGPQLASGTSGSRCRPCCSSATEEEKRGTEGRGHAGGPGPDGGPGETESKRARQEGTEEAAVLTSRIKVPRSCDPPAGEVPRPDQQEAAERSEDGRAAELQSAGSLKVTIQQSSESREFGQTDRTADRQTGGLRCHVCNLTCRSLQVFQEHMSEQEHLRKLQEITNGIHLNSSFLDRGRRPQPQRWCDTCQTHFSCDVIVHRRTKQHKACKQLCRPFCPVCKRHFRTPRKFVEHMKSEEHKQQVQLEDAQEEELITVDAVGCFEEEEEEEEELEEEVDVADGEDEAEEGSKELELEVTEEEAEGGEYDTHVTCGSRFVVPVCGFVCRLCNKFFYGETSARQTHCRTRSHYLNLQRHRARRRGNEAEEDTDLTALT